MILGIGCDLAETARIGAALNKKGFEERVFTERERAVGTGAHAVEHYAARFAAKEAFLKALGTGLREGRLQDIETGKDDLGKPVLNVTGRFRERLDTLGVTRIHVTLSHTRETAMAVVVLEGN